MEVVVSDRAHIVTQKIESSNYDYEHEEVRINKVYVKVGDYVGPQDVIANIENQKTAVDVPACASGRVVHMYVEAGQEDVPVGSPLVDIDTNAGSVRDATEEPQRSEAPVSRPASGEKKRVRVPAGRHIPPGSYTKETLPPPSDAAKDILEKVREDAGADAARKEGRAKAMPAVRKYAQERGVSMEKVSGSGREGTVTLNDIDRSAGRNAPQDVSGKSDMHKKEVPVSGNRRYMLDAMEAAREVVPAAIWDDVDISDWPNKSSVIARAVRSVAIACGEVPALNAWFDSKRCTRVFHEHVDIGIAIDVPRDQGESDLFVPVLGHAEGRTREEILAAITAMKRSALEGSVYKDSFGAKTPTISLSNFGSLGGYRAQLVIVPPQVAIVGLGRIFSRENKKWLPLSLTIDHRVVTGGEALRFMGVLKHNLEEKIM